MHVQSQKRELLFEVAKQPHTPLHMDSVLYQMASESTCLQCMHLTLLRQLTA